MLSFWPIVIFVLTGGVRSAAIRQFATGDKVDVFVNKVGPYANIHETYHYYQLPICRPEKVIHRALSLGQVLDGDRMAESAYDIRYKTDVVEQSLCGNRDLSIEDANLLVEAIEEDYYFEIIIDDMKVRNFVGYVEESKQVFPHEHKLFLYRHFVMTIEHNEDNQIISIQLEMDRASAVLVELDQSLSVDFKYSVKWIKTSKTLNDRPVEGTVFFSTRTMHIHWLSVINSALLVLLLLLFVALILFSAVRRDLSKYNSLDDGDLLMDNGWKTVGMDVFRKPNNPLILSAILGVGTQFLVIGAVIIIIASLNIINVHRHGMLNTLSLVLYALTSGIAGFVSARRYAQLEGKHWVLGINLTSLLFAAPMMVAWAVSNTVSWVNNSTQALPWTTVLVVLAIGLVCGYPLTVIGSLLGRNVAAKYSAPCRTRNIPRQLPALSWYHNTPIFAIVGGFLPFSAISVELYYIFSTIWGRESYTLFYMVAIVFVILLLVVACSSVGLTYFQLNAEDYHWWWRSVFIGGSVAGFVFVYGLFFLHYRSEMSGVVQLTEFFTHLLLMCYIAFLTMGTVSHFAAHRFVMYIYSSVKTD